MGKRGRYSGHGADQFRSRVTGLIHVQISLLYSTLPHLVMFWCAKFKLYWNNSNIFIFVPFLHFSILTIIISTFPNCFNHITAILQYLCLENFQLHWVQCLSHYWVHSLLTPKIITKRQ